MENASKEQGNTLEDRGLSARLGGQIGRASVFSPSVCPGSSCPQARVDDLVRARAGRISPADTARGRSFWRARSSTQSSASRADEVTAPVRITHPFHPQFGQDIDFVERRHRWGEERVLYRDRHGHLVSLPARCRARDCASRSTVSPSPFARDRRRRPPGATRAASRPAYGQGPRPYTCQSSPAGRPLDTARTGRPDRPLFGPALRPKAEALVLHDGSRGWGRPSGDRGRPHFWWRHLGPLDEKPEDHR